MARSGIVVLIPLSGPLDEVRITPAEVEALTADLLYLTRQSYVDPERIGYVGFCVGASLSLLAAVDPRIRDRVAFVNSFGAYYDIVDVVAAVSMSRFSYQGVEEPWDPDVLTVTYVRQGVSNLLSDPEDRAHLPRLLNGDPPATGDQLASLSVEGRIAYELLTTEDAQRAEEFLDLLSEDLRGGLAGISPRGEMEEMRAKVFLMHDRGDAFVPYVESLRLRDALQSVTEVRYTEFSLFEHVNPSEIHLSPAFAGEVIKLFRHLYLVLLEVA
jgi:signal transduction histidine kinase